MIRQFIKDIGVYGFSGILVRMISFLLIPFYVRVLTTEDYGIIDLVTIVSAISGVVLSMEIYQSIARFFPGCENKQKHIYASTGLYFYLFTYLLFAAIFLLYAKPLSEFIFNVNGKEGVFKLAVVAIVINSIFHYFQNLLRYSLKSVKYSISNILFSLSTISFSIFFVMLRQKGLEGVYLGQIVGGCIGLLLTVYFNHQYISLSVNLQVLKKMLRFSIPLVWSGLAVYSLTYIDRILIQRFLSLSELGIYGVSFRIASIPLVFMGIVNSSFVPLVYNKYKNSDIKAELEKIYRYVFFIGFAGITFISIFSVELLGIITTPEYLSAYRVMPFLLLSGFLMQFANMFLGLSLAEKTNIIACIYVFGLIVSFAVNFILIPVLGILGAAISSSFVALIIFSLQFHFSQKHYFVEFKYQPFLICTLVSIIAALSVYFIKIENLLISYTVKMLLFGIYFFTCIGLSKIVSWKALIRKSTAKKDEGEA
jgi:O-antigen/teichoic acid export membrane protein